MADERAVNTSGPVRKISSALPDAKLIVATIPPEQRINPRISIRSQNSGASSMWVAPGFWASSLGVGLLRSGFSPPFPLVISSLPNALLDGVQRFPISFDMSTVGL